MECSGVLHWQQTQWIGHVRKHPIGSLPVGTKQNGVLNSTLSNINEERVAKCEERRAVGLG